MKTILCGAGKYSRDLVGRLGENWNIVLIDPVASRLSAMVNRYPIIYQTIEGDASSPVVLDKAGISEAKFVLALTDDDSVNLAIARCAHEENVMQILALVGDPEKEPLFSELGVRTILPANMVGKVIYHYLQDPRININSICHTRGEIVEMDVSRTNWVVGLSVASFENPDWRVVGIFKNGCLTFPRPHDLIEKGDRLVLIGQRDFFKEVCSLIASRHLPFPLSFGRGILLLHDPRDQKVEETLKETMYLAANTRAGHVTLLHSREHRDVADRLNTWSGRVEIRAREAGERPMETISDLSKEQSMGLVIIRPFEKSLFKSLTRPEIIDLANSLPVPMLIAKHSHPYKRIFVPFNGSDMSAYALDIAIDIAEQLRGEVDVVFVRSPDFIHSEESLSADTIFHRAREHAHIHKVNVGEILLEGNPVRELKILADEYDLMVMGSTSKEKEFLTPHVGELIAERVSCSVLILTA